jgi:DNA-binding response OmpR family regulator
MLFRRSVVTFRKRVLLIERDPSHARGVREALERTGRYAVREEHNDQTALETSRWFHPDLILLDHMTSSDEATQLAHDTPLLCMSALNEKEVASAGVLGGYTFFAGPMRIDEVVRGIDELLFA